MDIQFFNNDQINKHQWDEYIANSTANLIYGQSVYLDYMSEGWCALIDKESESVMPIPLKKKMGISYAYQPPFTQQLGIFSSHLLDEHTIKSFLSRVSEIARSVDLYLNYTNAHSMAKERCNYVLQLNDSFENISKSFKKNLVTKPMDSGLEVVEASVKEMFEMYRKFVLPKNQTLAAAQLLQFEKLANHFLISGKAFLRKTISAKGDMLSVALFFNHDGRIYYMMSANTPDGREFEANSLLLYETIRELSGQNFIFDFEGSEIPGVKFFFEKFNPVNQPYFYFESDRLNKIQQVGKLIIDKIR